MDNVDSLFESLVLELRRGTLVLSVLGTLKVKKYGYALVQDIKKSGLEIDQGTLYPLLRRLEKQGLLESDWQLEGARPRRYYVISDGGKVMLDRLKTEWYQLSAILDNILKA